MCPNYSDHVRCTHWRKAEKDRERPKCTKSKWSATFAKSETPMGPSTVRKAHTGESKAQLRPAESECVGIVHTLQKRMVFLHGQSLAVVKNPLSVKWLRSFEDRKELRTGSAYIYDIVLHHRVNNDINTECLVR